MTTVTSQPREECLQNRFFIPPKNLFKIFTRDVASSWNITWCAGQSIIRRKLKHLHGYRVKKDSLQFLVKGGRSSLTFFRVTWVFFSLHFKFFGTSVRKLQAKELLYVFDMEGPNLTDRSLWIVELALHFCRAFTILVIFFGNSSYQIFGT
jgi:hypothetical protein